MPNLFKNRQQKAPKLTTSTLSQNVTSTSTLTSTEQSDLPIEKIDWALEIAGIVKDVSEGSPLLGPLKATCGLIIRGLELARDTHQTRLDLQEITEVLKNQEKDIGTLAARFQDSEMKGTPALQLKLDIYLKNIRETLAETSVPAKESKRKRFDLLGRTRPTNSTQEEIPALKRKLESSYQDFMEAALLVASEKVDERALLAIGALEALKPSEDLTEREHSGDDYDYDSPLPLLYGHGIPCCQPGTRTAILADINQWSMDAETTERIYWLKDAAGTGKTTVAATCARDWQVKQTLAGRFFFTPNSEASSGVDRFCTTVAKDIAFLVPSLDGIITAALDELSRRRCGFHEQFERLIVKPLQSSKLSYPMVLVFDALDNCDPDGRKLLLNCLLKHLLSFPHVKVLLTSRPSPDIVGILSKSSQVKGQDVQLLDIHDEVRTDVRIFVQSTLNRLNHQEREKVVEYSGGLFIVAATVCRMLRLSTNPATLLNKLLTANSKDHLDELYLEVLRQAVWNGGAHEKMMSVLQIIIITFQPVSINTIAYFLLAKFDVGKFVQDLGAVLKDGHPERPIKVLHPTFREFLGEFERANGFIINKSSSHALAATGCLRTLEKLLDYDILRVRGTHRVLPRNIDVKDLPKKMAVATTAALRYASSYWIYHVTASLDSPTVWPQTMQFLNSNLLSWIELMSWRGMLSLCLQGMSQLRVSVRRAMEKSDFINPSDFARVLQAYRFLLQHQPLIQESALHTYSSGLAFTPNDSSMWMNYRRQHVAQMPRITTIAPIRWNYDVLTGHSKTLEQVEFSPDGGRLVTRAHDCTLRLWDTSSGALISHPYQGSSGGQVRHSTFSSSALAFATASSKIHLWSSATGEKLAPSIDLEPWEIRQIAFHPTHPYVVSMSAAPSTRGWDRRGSIQMWNISDGAPVGKLMSLEEETLCFSISPTGIYLVCVSCTNANSRPGMVSMWNTNSCAQVTAYQMPNINRRSCAEYSADGSRFVTWDRESIIYLRDGITGDQVLDMKASHDATRTACFSPYDMDYLVSYGDRDSHILLWSCRTGLLKCLLSGHTARIVYTSFAQDGKRLASISNDQTIRVWDITTGTNLESFFTGYTGSVYRPALSPDWSKLVTVSIANQLNLYDAADGVIHGEEKPGEDMHFATPNVAFSPRGDVMACGYYDLDNTSILGLWSLETAAPLGDPMVGHRMGISCIAFSPAATHIVSGSEDGTVRLWNATTGIELGVFRVEDPKHLSFSPDGDLLASSSPQSIQLWNVHTQKSVWKTDRRSIYCAIEFSPDGSSLAGSSRYNLSIWSISRSQPVKEREDVFCTLLAFSPTKNILASASHDRVQIWNIEGSISLFAEFTIKKESGFKLGISLNGEYLAYGSSIWDISSSNPLPFPLHEVSSTFLRSTSFPHSLLTYKDGWVHSACPSGPLMPIPGHLRDQFRDWTAYGNKVIVWTQERVPVVIDCAPLMVDRG